jgi:hypothetical protein
MRRAIVALPLLLLALVPSSGAQALPPCGAEQFTAGLSVEQVMYATHTYFAEVTFDPPSPPPSTKVYEPVNVRVTGPGWAVSRFRFDGRADFDLRPETAGTLPLTVSWDQKELEKSEPDCSASATFERTVGDALPVVLRPFKRKPVYGLEGPGYGFTLRFVFATKGPDKDAWDAADMTPIRVEARAVRKARRPSRAIAPAVIEFPPGEPRVRRDTKGVVQVRRAHPRGDPYLAEVFVATRKGTVRRGLTVDVTQGSRVIGSFTLVGTCRTRISYGNTSVDCNFKGRQPWLGGYLH